jgi:hypothetical protein
MTNAGTLLTLGLLKFVLFSSVALTKKVQQHEALGNFISIS